MRTIIVLPALIALGACNVSTNQANDSLTVQYNDEAAANMVNTVSNTAENVASDISNDVGNTADKIDNRIGDDNANANATANEQQGQDSY